MSTQFKVSPDTLRKLVDAAFNSKSEAEVKNSVMVIQEDELGGINGIAESICTHLQNGISSSKESIEQRQAHFGRNEIPQEPQEGILSLMWGAAQDPTLIILMVAAVVSLGINMAFEEEKDIAWIESAAILITCFIVTLVAAVNDYKKESQFRKLNTVKEDAIVNVFRDGKEHQTSVFGVCVGDIVKLEVGDVVCADGYAIKCHGLKVNESTLTGESDDLNKGKFKFVDGKLAESPFLFSSTQVMEGTATMVIVAVGTQSVAGNITKILKETEKEDSVLQSKLNNMAELIGKGGLAVATLTFIALMIKFVIEFFTDCKCPLYPAEGVSDFDALVKAAYESKDCTCAEGQEPGGRKEWDNDMLNDMLHSFITAVTLLVVAVPEGLPLAVTITMAYSVRRMLIDQNLVRHLDACETMGGATTICSDKTGTLTTNRMTVMRSWVGTQLFKWPYDQEGNQIKKRLLAVLHASIAHNTTARLKETESGPPEHIGNKTECAMLALSKALGGDYEAQRASRTKDQEERKKIYTFSSARKRMSTLIPTGKNTFRLYCKGAAEIVAGTCNFMLNQEGEPVPFTKADSEHVLKNVVSPFASDVLRCIALAIRDFEGEEVQTLSQEEVEQDMTLVAILGIEDPVRPEVPKAITICHNAGICVRMVTGDNIETARSIARKCGILTGDGMGKYEVLEGPDFRAMCVHENGDLKQDKLDEIWPGLRVLARSSPTDKYSLVSGIKKSLVTDLQIVAVTGDGTNDGPALKQADVGFAMGVTGTAIAKEASDIILMDDNFNSIVKAVKWGRNVYDNVGKFLQFQLTVNIVAVVLCFVSSVVTSRSALSTVQMLWVNLIMDSFAALALATELPDDKLLDRKPYPRDRSLLSRLMWRFMLGHAMYQLIVLFLLMYWFEEWVCLHPEFHNKIDYGPDCGIDPKLLAEQGLTRQSNLYKEGFSPQSCLDLCMDNDSTDHRRFLTLIFNTFVFFQIFNEINARKLNNEMNVFEALFTNKVFATVIIGTILVQLLLVGFDNEALKVRVIPWQYWVMSICLGALELPWNVVLHFVWPKFLLAEPIQHSTGGPIGKFGNKVTDDATTAGG